jgi:crotonobetainyl-CoA:carnitine CoA-transferase CaiB-like acyl-CoA transferase
MSTSTTSGHPAAGDELPLAGLRVVEFTHMVMGPVVGLILADLGAEVVKVEPPGGDNTRRLGGSGAGYFPMYNRNKRSICLDTKSEQGRAVAQRLCERADVVIENFRPGAMDKLGLGYAALSARNAGLIYCSLKGFLKGPYQHRTALDEVTQMMGGLAYMTGLPGRPMRAGASVIDVTGGMFGVIAILAALEQRRRTGRGQHVQSSLFETTGFLVGQHMAQHAVTQKPLQPMSVRTSAWAVYDIFDTADGQQLFVGVVSDTQWKLFCEAFALTEFAADRGLDTNTTRVARREQILPVIRERFRSLGKQALMDKLEHTGLPFAPIARPEDLFDDPQLNAGGLVEVTLADGRRAKLPALPVAFGGQRMGLRRDLPKSGDDLADVLSEWGYDSAEIAALRSATQP